MPGRRRVAAGHLARQALGQAGRDGDRPAFTGTGLDRPYLAAVGEGCPAYSERPAKEVDVAHLEGDQLADAQATSQPEGDHELVRKAHGLEEALDFADGEVPLLGLRGARHLHLGGRVRGYQPVQHGSREAGPQDCDVTFDGGRGDPAAHLAGHPLLHG
jgi:hypothetical protein